MPCSQSRNPLCGVAVLLRMSRRRRWLTLPVQRATGRQVDGGLESFSPARGCWCGVDGLEVFEVLVCEQACLAVFEPVGFLPDVHQGGGGDVSAGQDPAGATLTRQPVGARLMVQGVGQALVAHVSGQDDFLLARGSGDGAGPA
jgi:hypothetical protein